MPTYTQQYNLAVSGADTTVGSTPDSTGGVPDLKDHQGDLFQRISNSIREQTNSPGFDYPINCLYRSNGAGDVFANGYVEIWRDYSVGSGAGVLVGRFDPTAGHEKGYAVQTVNANAVYFYKSVDGASIQIGFGDAWVGASVPLAGETGDVIRLYISDVSPTSTQLIVKAYTQASVTAELSTGTPAAAVASFTFPDNSSPVQTAGAWGMGPNNNPITRLRTATLDPAPLDAGSLIPTQLPTTAPAPFRSPITPKTTDLGFGTAPSGGSGSITSILFKYSEGTSGTFSNLGTAGSAATKSDVNKSVGGTTRYFATVTDSAGATADTPIITVVRPTDCIGIVADSIGYGGGTSGVTASQQMIADVIAAGHAIGWVNCSVSGDDTAAFLPASGPHWAAALAAMQAAGVNKVQIALGVNDSRVSAHRSAANYKTNIQAIQTALLAGLPGSVVLAHYPSYVDYAGTSGQWDSASDALLQAYGPALDTLVNGTTVLQGSNQPYVTFATKTAPYLLNASDHIHPDTQGAPALGHEWATANNAAFYPSDPEPEVSIVPLFFRMDSGIYAAQHRPITPSDTADIPTGPCVVYVGTGGDVSCVDDSGLSLTYKNLPSGSKLPTITKRVNEAGTTATDLVALY